MMKLTRSDRPVKEGSYSLRFLGFVLATSLRGTGGEDSIRRSTSSSEGGRGACLVGSGFMVGV